MNNSLFSYTLSAELSSQSLANTWSNSVLVTDDLAIVATDYWSSQHCTVGFFLLWCHVMWTLTQCDIIMQVAYMLIRMYSPAITISLYNILKFLILMQVKTWLLVKVATMKGVSGNVMEVMKELQYHCQRIHNHKASLNVHQKESTISIPLNLKLN